jgi:hypothetical protein
MEARPAELEAKQPLVPVDVLVADQANSPAPVELLAELLLVREAVLLMFDQPTRWRHPTPAESGSEPPVGRERTWTRRAGDDHPPARRTDELVDRLPPIAGFEVLQHVESEDDVEGPIGEWQPASIADDDPARRRTPGSAHRSDVGEGPIDSGNGPTLVDPARHALAAAAHVEHFAAAQLVDQGRDGRKACELVQHAA